jgi:hypothetical protein
MYSFFQCEPAKKDALSDIPFTQIFVFLGTKNQGRIRKGTTTTTIF